MAYDKDPQTPFQRFIRLTQQGKIHIHFNKHRYDDYY